MSSPDTCIKPLRKRFPLKKVFQNPVRFGFFSFEMELPDFSSKRGSNTFSKKHNNKISTHCKITPNATQISGHFLSNYSKSCCSSSFTPESLTNRMQGDICIVNQTIYRFPKLHAPVSPPCRTVIKIGSRLEFPTQHSKE